MSVFDIGIPNVVGFRRSPHHARTNKETRMLTFIVAMAALAFLAAAAAPGAAQGSVR